MATATTLPLPSPSLPPGQRLLTAADLAALPRTLPSGDVKYELNDGKLVIMPPPGDIHGAASLSIGSYLYWHGQLQGHGKARGEVGVILRRNPDRVVGPDACFIANASLPLKQSPEGYLETIPDLVVEVRSKNDTLPEIESKVGEYLAAGVKLVWLLDPIRTCAIVYEAGQPPRTLGPGDDLTADHIIPGFRLPVAVALQG